MSTSNALGTTERRLVGIAAGALWTAAVAWLAFQIQQEEIAPVVLFPLLVGALVGAGGLAIARATRADGFRATLLAAIVWGLLVVVAQDYIAYRRHLRAYDAALVTGEQGFAATGAGLQMRPDFAGFLTGRMRAQPAWWALDLVLTAGGSALVTALASGRKTTPDS